MLNRYAKFSIGRWANSDTYIVNIDRAGRPYGHFYRHVTNSSLKRLHYIDDTYLCKIIYNPHENFHMYEWQPTSVVSFITDIAVDTIAADKKEHIVRKYVENQTDGEALHDAIENTYLYSEIKEWIADEGYSQIDWNEVLKRVKNAE